MKAFGKNRRPSMDSSRHAIPRFSVSSNLKLGTIILTYALLEEAMSRSLHIRCDVVRMVNSSFWCFIRQIATTQIFPRKRDCPFKVSWLTFAYSGLG